MHIVFALVRLFPFWGLSLAYIFYEVGKYFRRKKSSQQWLFFGLMGLLIVLTLLWFIFGGLTRTDVWVKALIEP